MTAVLVPGPRIPLRFEGEASGSTLPSLDERGWSEDPRPGGGGAAELDDAPGCLLAGHAAWLPAPAAEAPRG
jgi:hypothetical protein